MKRIILFIFLAVYLGIYPQSKLFSDNSSKDVTKIDPRTSRYNFVPAEILIKLKDDIITSLHKDANQNSLMGINSVDKILQKYQANAVEKLLKDALPNLKKKRIITYNGQTIEVPNLHNIYKIKITDKQKTLEAIENLKKDSNLDYAEPNYLFSIISDKAESRILTEKDIKWIENRNLTLDKSDNTNSHVIVPNDPFYTQEWWIQATQIDEVWNNSTGDSSQIIAILDTGVDWTHPDLTNNIWKNPNEIPYNGKDDDNNGFIDDTRGWDYINNDNNPMDDNSHGTHVAGIAAAEGNNGIGIAGVNWRAKIMPIKVFQSSGGGDAGTITQGLIYAMNHKATVINMSFGSYARSLTMEAALQNAYATAVLVSAAGNDGVCIGPALGCAPYFPAALSYALGIQATTTIGGLAGFSNFDQDGSVYSVYADLLNYEMKAPGDQILSTIPNGNYRVYSGTSMATPLISGAVSLYRHIKPGQSQELMLGNLINTTKEHIKLFDAININSEPQLWLVSNTIVDTLSGDNNNNLVDAGETIQLWFNARNTWGQSDSVFIGLNLGEYEDTSVANILNPIEYVGSMSPYATGTNELNPFVIIFNNNISNNRDVVFQVLLWAKNSIDTIKQDVILKVYHGQYLSGVLDGNLILEPNFLWIINNSFRVGSNSILTIKPGVHLIINSTMDVRGTVIADGTKDSLIIIEGNASPTFTFKDSCSSFNYVKFQYLSHPLGDYNSHPTRIDITNSIFENVSGEIGNRLRGVFINNIVRNSNLSQGFWNDAPRLIIKNNFYNNILGSTAYLSRKDFYYNNFESNTSPNWGNEHALLRTDFLGTDSMNSIGNSFINTNGFSFQTYGSYEIVNLNSQYWGTDDSLKILKQSIYDFWADPSLSLAKFWPYLDAPSDSAHGIVWKILVNGKDAQDEIVDPVGVGTQRFDVFFNRTMDSTYTPQISFGVREPFTQQKVTDSTSWSSDNKIWTAYKAINLFTGDGINTIRVEEARDPEGFEIPIENKRFSFLINAVGSASNDFSAINGVGKVLLNLTRPELIDILGYNIYRFSNATDTTYSNPIRINNNLVIDSLFIDVSTLPNKKYYYYYKIVNTDLTESTPSKTISITTGSSLRGDSNNDLTVDGLDIVSDVSYIFNENPSPFSFAAADVNTDSVINILDIIGTVNIVLHPLSKINRLNKIVNENSMITFSSGILGLNSEIPVGGIQIIIKGKSINNFHMEFTSYLNGFEIQKSSIDDSTLIYLIYSLNGQTFFPGNIILGTSTNQSNDFSLSEYIISDGDGNNILTILTDNNDNNTIPVNYYLDQNYPNPFNPETIIHFGLPRTDNVNVVIYNILGQRVKTFVLGEKNAGHYSLLWNGKTDRDVRSASGIYIYRIETPNFLLAKKMVLLK